MAALEGRTALVTGASSGIGLATALAFADAGAHVHAAARRPELIEEAAAGRDVVAHHSTSPIARPSPRWPRAWPPTGRCTRSWPPRGRTSRRAASTSSRPRPSTTSSR